MSLGWRSWLRGVSIVAVSVLACAASFGQERVTHEVEVVEAAILVKAPGMRVGALPRVVPGLPRTEGAGPNVVPRRRVRQQDLVVYLEDRPLQIQSVQRLDREQPWTVLLFLDAELSGSETLFRSALALAKVAPTLTSLGLVELIVAAEQTQVRLPPTRHARALENALGDIALEAGAGTLRRPESPPRSPANLADSPAETAATPDDRREADRIARRVSTLIGATRDRCPTETCLLLLVTEGFSEVAATPSGSPAASPEGADCCGSPGQQIARELAAARWLTGVVTLREPPSTEEDHARQRPSGSRQGDLAGSGGGTAQGTTSIFRRRRRAISPEKLDLVVRPESEPLERIARATGGFLAASPRDLELALADLDDRLLVWVRVPPDPPTEPTPLRVVFAPSGTALWAPRWWRGSPPAAQ